MLDELQTENDKNNNEINRNDNNNVNNVENQVNRNNDDNNAVNNNDDTDNKNNIGDDNMKNKSSSHENNKVKELLNNIDNYLTNKPQSVSFPKIQFIFEDKDFFQALDGIIQKYLYIESVNDSNAPAFVKELKSSLDWFQSETKNSFMKLGNYFKQIVHNETSRLQSSLPIVYCNVEKNIVEEFAHYLKAASVNYVVTDDVITIINYQNNEEFEKYFEKFQKNAVNVTTNSSTEALTEENENLNDKSIQKDADKNQIIKENTENINVLQRCIILFSNEHFDRNQMDAIINHLRSKYNIDSIFPIEMKCVKESKNKNKNKNGSNNNDNNNNDDNNRTNNNNDNEKKNNSNENPASQNDVNSFFSRIFYENDGVLIGQESIFEMIAQTISSNKVSQ